MDAKAEIRELNNKLKEASRAYYQEGREIMSNFDYDALYDRLLELEKETGIILSDSVTQHVGYEVVSELPKIEHEKAMLSLDKTKSVDDLKSWLADQEALLSWKLDGLTIVLTYDGGELQTAVTRGNGYVGELVTANVKQFKNVPLKIPFAGRLVIRGEAVIKYSDFEQFSEEYKNPRNLCSGSVRQLNSEITAQRNVNCYIFALVSGGPELKLRSEQFEWLKGQGFDTVPYLTVNAGSIADAVKKYAEEIKSFDVPSDGLVLLLNDIAYGESLGMTAKFPRNAIAFKWKDETAETVLKYIEWSPSRTGLINPVAVFEPVEIEGSTVSRASVHNVSILESLKLGVGDHIMVYKANMIIPQIAENLTGSGAGEIPKICPVCGGETVIKNENDVKTLYCINEDCPVKKIKSFALLAGRDAMNIDGLSEMTLEKLIAEGFVKEFADLFKLERYRSEIAAMDGFGEKSAENLISATQKASHTTLPKLIYSLGIPGIGAANAKVLARHFDFDFDKIRHASVEELTGVDGIGAVLAEAIVKYFADAKNNTQVDELLKVVDIQKEAISDNQPLKGKTFVITGSLERFENRKQLEELIESLGGKCSGSVSAKTSYLINNDLTSTSGKNKKARELEIPIISESVFVEMVEKFK